MRPAPKQRTIRHLDFHLPATNQKVGSSNLSGRTTSSVYLSKITFHALPWIDKIIARTTARLRHRGYGLSSQASFKRVLPDSPPKITMWPMGPTFFENH